MVTITQARKLLPEGYNLTDKELAAVIADWYGIANLAMDEFLKRQKEKGGGKR